MNRFEGRFFDGRSSRAHPVTVFFDGDRVRLTGPSVALDARLSELKASKRLARAPRWLTFPDGGQLELPDSDAVDAQLASAHQGAMARLVSWLERHWGAVGVSALATVVVLAGLVQFGIPALAAWAAAALPPSVAERLGESTLKTLDATLFRDSTLADRERGRLRALFDRLVGDHATPPRPRLVFRGGGRIGANAFALPSGVVIVTDQLVGLSASDEEISGVLAHELGHVANRHGLRSVLQSAGIGVLIATLLGDVVSASSLAATAPMLLVELQYSRRFEEDADTFAVARLREVGLPAGALARMLERLEEEAGGNPLPAYLSSHPSTRSRIQAIARE